MATNNFPPPPASAPYDDFKSPQWQAWFRQVRDYSLAFSIGLTMPTNTFTVSNSPLTHNGTIGVTYNNQTASTILAAPSGGAGTPTWRALGFTELNFTGSNLTSIQTRNHNDLQNIQGGTASDYQHLTTIQVNRMKSNQVLTWLSM